MECPICFSAYSPEACIPLVLPCGHTFCKACLSQLPLVASELVCPSCRKSTTCPSIDNISLNYSILDTLQPEKEQNEEEFCTLHEKKKVKFYCQKCGSYFCTKCVVLHTSAEHQIIAASMYVDQKLQFEAQRLSKSLEKVKNNTLQVDKIVENLQNKRNAVEKVYEEAENRLQKEKESRLSLLDRLISDLRSSISQFQAYHDKSTSLSAELFQVQHSQSSLKSKKTHLECLANHSDCPDIPISQAALDIRMLQIPIEGLIQVKIKRNRPINPGNVADIAVLEGAKGDIPRPAIWQFYNNRGFWVPYSLEASAEVERALKSGRKEVTLGYYRVDLVNYRQVNVKTGFERPIRRSLA